MTSLLARRWVSVGVAAAMRQHLEQEFRGFTLTGVYMMGRHQITGRCDFMNCNKGGAWYGAHNPCTQNTATGAALGQDCSPKYAEVVLGYGHFLNPGNSPTAR